MNKRTWIIIGVAVLLLAGGIGAYVVSRQAGGHWRPSPGAGVGAVASGSRVLVQGQQVMELARALEIADTHVHGEVLKVELERDDDRFVYEIKVLADNGRVREIKLDAYTGGLIKIEDD